MPIEPSPIYKQVLIAIDEARPLSQVLLELNPSALAERGLLYSRVIISMTYKKNYKTGTYALHRRASVFRRL